MEVPSFFSCPLAAIANHIPLTSKLLAYQSNEYKAMAIGYWGILFSVIGVEWLARILLRKAKIYFEIHPNPVSTAFLIFVEGYLFDFPAGRLVEANLKIEKALKITTEIGETFWRFLAYQGLAHIDYYGGDTERAPHALDSLNTMWHKTKFNPTILGTNLRQNLLESDMQKVNYWNQIVIDAGLQLNKQGFVTIDSVYAALSPGEMYLQKGDLANAVSFLRKAFWGALLNFHRVAYCHFAAPLLALAYCKSNKPFRAIIPLTVAWMNILFNVKLLLPQTLWATGEWLTSLKMRWLGMKVIQRGYRHAHRKGWNSVAMEGRLLFAAHLSQVDPRGSLDLLRGVEKYCSERGWSFPKGQSINLMGHLEKNLAFISNDSKDLSTQPFSNMRLQIETSSLIDMFMNLSILTNEDQLYGTVLDTFTSCTGANQAVIFLDLNGQWQPVFAIGFNLEMLQQKNYLNAGLDKSFFDYFVSGPMLEPLTRNGDRHGYDQGSVLVIPLNYGGTTLGIVYVTNKHISNLFDRRCLEIITPIASQAAIALKNLKLIDETNSLNASLERKVETRTQELRLKNIDMKAILTHMKQGVFKILSNGKLHEEYSDYLEIIFETKNLAGKDALDLLTSNTNLKTSEIALIKDCVASSLGQEFYTYFANEHILPKKLNITKPRNKTLELSWTPIIVDDITEKIIVTVIDMTEILYLRKNAEKKEEDLTILGELLAVREEVLNRFFAHNNEYLTQSLDLIKNGLTANQDSLKQVFMNIHTVKGASRMIGFKRLAEVIHHIEEPYSLMLKSEHQEHGGWNDELLTKDMLSVLQEMSRYEKIHREKIKDRIPTSDAYDAKLIQLFNELYSCDFTKLEHLVKLGDCLESLSSKLYRNLGTLITEEFKISSTEIAKQLNKLAPEIKVDGSEILLTPDGEKLVMVVLTHLLRNSIDHGIEEEKVRLSKGKSPVGQISIYTIEKQGQITIAFSDDGRGVNLANIKASAVQYGLTTEGKSHTPHEIIDFLFQEGFSTAKVLSEISGRGVGLSAVRHYLLEHQGAITIALDEKIAPDTYLFKIMIDLPRIAYIKPRELLEKLRTNLADHLLAS